MRVVVVVAAAKLPAFLFLLTGIAGMGQVLSWEDRMSAAAALKENGHYREALQVMLEALRAARAFGPDDERQAITRDALAAAYDALGNLWQAERYQREAVGFAERILGPESPRHLPYH